jgi:uncharacterized protein YcaQ
MHHLTREQARRVAVRAQRLDLPRPTDLLDLVEHLTYLPVDTTPAIAPAADLVAWSRLGSAYSPDELVDALAARELVEYDATVRAADDLPVLAAGWAAWPPWPQTRDWLEANDLFRAEVLDALEDSGPMLAREVHATAQVPWRSSGWNTDRNVTMLLEVLEKQGVVAVDGRRGRQRLWNLASRVHPPGLVPVPEPEASRRRDERRLRALGIARARGTEIPGESVHVGEAGEPATVEGVRGEWRVDPAHLDGVRDGFEGRAALLSPFDALVRDRRRMEDLFEFDYVLEMYKPAAKRRWGYFALPVLHHDRLVGKLDATADRKAGRLFVDAVHEDGRWTRAMRSAVDDEVSALADWLGLERA